MSIFDVLTMIGGLCLFLFGMDLMGQSLERRAGGKLRTLLDRMTGRVFTGFLTGLAITAVIQPERHAHGAGMDVVAVADQLRRCDFE